MARVSPEIGHRTVTDAAVTTFGALTGDYARMHFDRDFGSAAGGGEPIAHGLLGAAWALGALRQHAPERLATGLPGAFLESFEVRFTHPLRVGDRFALRWSGDGERAPDRSVTGFEATNQDRVVTHRGRVEVSYGTGAAGSTSPDTPAPVGTDADAANWRDGETLYAEDLLERGPRGVSLGRTVTEADLVAFAQFTGDLDPLVLNEPFARTGPFGARIASPMWTFCLGFADFLRELLRAPLPDAGFAGHLGDSWRLLAPVLPGDTLRTRHVPVGCTPSQTRPEMAIVSFALQLQNQRDEIVQDGFVAMMVPRRR